MAQLSGIAALSGASVFLDEAKYKEGFAGLTADSCTGEQTLISGATASTNAMTVATDDVFAAFQAISATDGGNN